MERLITKPQPVAIGELSPTYNTLINTIRAMYECENGSVNGMGSYLWRRNLADTIPISFFRRFGVLSQLNIDWDGDIALAVREAFPNPTSKPLLQLDDPRPTDPLYTQWLQREEEIESRIETTRSVKKPLEIPFFRERKVRHGGRWIKVQTGENHFERMLTDEWWKKENKDLNETINKFTRSDQDVLFFLGGHHAVLPSIILANIRPEGKLYVVTPGPFLEQGLFANFLKYFCGASSFKAERNTEAERKRKAFVRSITGSNFIDPAFREEARAFLSHPYRYNERFYREGLNWQNTLLMQRFFEHFNIHPFRVDGPDLPADIPSRSLDAVVEADRFAMIAEEDMEATLFELDRVLTPGGYLVFREGSRQQALLEYYGQELFNQKYRRVRVRDMRSAQLVVLQKEGAKEPLEEVVVRDIPSRQESRRLKPTYSFEWLPEEGDRIISIGSISQIQQVLGEMEPEKRERLRMTKLLASDVFKWLGQVSKNELQDGESIKGEETFHGWRRLPRGKQWELLLINGENNHITFHLRRLAEGQVWEGRDNGTLSERDKLIAELVTAVAQSNDSDGPTLSLSWFRKNGFLPILISEFDGDIDKAIEAAMKGQEQVKTRESRPIIRPPEGARSTYTIDDLAREFNIPKREIRNKLQKIGIRQVRVQNRSGQPIAFTRRAVASRQLNFSYQEYVVIKEALKSQDTEDKERSNNESG